MVSVKFNPVRKRLKYLFYSPLIKITDGQLTVRYFFVSVMSFAETADYRG